MRPGELLRAVEAILGTRAAHPRQLTTELAVRYDLAHEVERAGLGFGLAGAVVVASAALQLQGRAEPELDALATLLLLEPSGAHYKLRLALLELESQPWVIAVRAQEAP